MIAALGDFGVEAARDRRADRGLGRQRRRRRPATRARSARSAIHVSRGVTTHGFAVNVNNDLQPFEWIVPCGIEACRMTSLTRELGAEQDVDAFASAARYAGWAQVYEREPVRDARRRSRSGQLTLECVMSKAAERIHVTRSRANPGGASGIEGTAVSRAQAAVAEGPGARRADLPAAEEVDRGRQPAHRLRGGQLPERRRVLGARHRDLHDPRRRLHPPLRLLQRADRRADLERPARAAARRDPGEEDGPAPRRRHLGRPRRPARLRRRRLRRRDPLDPDAGARTARSRS